MHIFFLSLCLEWNAFGMLDNSFAMFCDGVGSNDALQALDLRNNQISHDGAVELAAALKRNHTLRALGRSTFQTWTGIYKLTVILVDLSKTYIIWKMSFINFIFNIMYYLKQFDMYIFECSRNVDDNFISYDKKRSHDHVMKTLVIFVLDLRWNSVGLLGGRAILEMLKTNKTICRLELAGNNIPGDILKSIGKNCL